MIKKFNFSDNKSIENEKEDDNTKKISNEIEDEGCGCCCDDDDTSSLSPSSLPSSINFTPGKSNIEEEEQEREEKNKKKKNKNAKTLILIGVVLTIPLVVVELLQFYNILKDDIIIDYMYCFHTWLTF